MKARFYVLPLAAALLVSLAGSANAGGPAAKTKMDTPTISCAGSGTDYIDLKIKAGPTTGAPAGVTIQWMTAADYIANGNTFNGASSNLNVHYCDASFSGNAALSNYSLAPNGEVTVRVGDLTLDSGASTNCGNEALLCGTSYVFRAFAHGTSTLTRSDFTSVLNCSTSACNTNCDPGVKSQGFWKTHPEAWPADVVANGMTVGCQTYTATELLSILTATPAGGNALVSLAHQVITARLNLLNNPSQAYIDAVTANLVAAEALMCTTGKVPPIGAGSLTGAQAGTLTTALDTTRAAFECP